MTYTAPSKNFLKNKLGTDSSVIAGELAKIDTEIDGKTTAINNLTDVFVAGQKIAKVRCTGAVLNGISFAWANPETVKIIIDKVVLHIFDPETVGSGTTLDIGTAANGTTGSDNLIDGVLVTSAGIFDNVTDKGTNGKTVAVLDTTEFVTGQFKEATGASCTGCAYIFYTRAGFLE